MGIGAYRHRVELRQLSAPPVVAAAAPAPAIEHLGTVVDTPGPTGGTTDPIDTTGADCLVVAVAMYDGVPSVADSRANSWIPLTRYSSSASQHQFFYALAPSVGPEHTFTVIGPGIYPVVVVNAFRHVGVFDRETGGAGNLIITTGPLTPSSDGALILFGAAVNSPFPLVSDPIPAQVQQEQLPGNSVAGSCGFVIQTTAAPVAITWTWPIDQGGGASLAVFSPVATPPPEPEPDVWDCSVSSVATQVVDGLTGFYVRGRFHPGITLETQILFEERTFQVQAITDVDERHVELQLFCVEVVGRA